MIKSIKYLAYRLLAVLMSLFVIVGCSDDDDAEPYNDVGSGTVKDIDGNEYKTVTIGSQEWMAENLRVTRYNNGDTMPTGLSNAEWGGATSGAYAIYDHNQASADGINSPEEMVAAYGKLYNWYAVNTGNLCPEGWSVPSDDDWTHLVDYIMDKYDYHNDVHSDNINGVGNALKSCHQDGSPLGGDCYTSEQPRWSSHDTHYGFDEFGFSALPGGNRYADGFCYGIGRRGYWWSSGESSWGSAWYRHMAGGDGFVERVDFIKSLGLSIRCVRDSD